MERRKVEIDFMVELLEDFIHRGGIAFGGVVRDLLTKHNPVIASNRFEKQEIDYDNIIDIPLDIDILVSREMYNKIMECYFESHYYIKKIKDYRGKNFSYTSSRDDLELIGYEVLKELVNERYVKVKVDFLVLPNIDLADINCYPPFSDQTLECDVNCLIFDKYRGLSVSPKLINNVIQYNNFKTSTSHIVNIFDNIKSKKMVVFRDMETIRVEHMLSKGWTIKDVMTENFVYDKNETFDDVCIICKENFSDNDLKIRINDSKCSCNIRYCIGCIKEMSRKNVNHCPYCKIFFDHSRINIDDVKNEIELLTIYKK